MSDLAAFLKARLDEDDQRAERGSPSRYDNTVSRAHREVEAKRKILAEHERATPSAQLRYALLLLAAVYSDHPDYDEDWKP